MNHELREAIVEALTEAESAFSKLDTKRLKGLSETLVQNVSIFQEPAAITIAVTIYSLAKVMDNMRLYKHRSWEVFQNSIVAYLSEAKKAIVKKEDRKYAVIIKGMLKDLSLIDESLGKHISEVIERSRVKKGSAIYEHGLSVGKAAQLMGISPWELMSYIGKTKIMDTSGISPIPVDERMQFARRLFRL